MGRLINLCKIALLGLFVISGCSVMGSKIKVAQSTSDSLLISQYDFVNVAADTIFDPLGSLSPFYDQLRKLQSWTDPLPFIVPIVHYGDSHLQGGMLTETIMRHFAAKFGSAGRGMIVPHRLSGKNEPRDFSITSPSKHNASTIIESRADLPFGVSGVSVQSPPPTKYLLRILPLPDDTLDFRFNRVVVYHDSLAPMITAVNDQMMDEDGGSDLFRPFTTEINLLAPTDSLSLRTYSEPPFVNGPIYGFSLENGRSGVIYHSMGVNGACFLHFSRHDNIAAQSAALDPRLIIVSLGSNEAAGTNFIASVFEAQMDGFISKLRAANPSAALLLTTPPAVMRRSRGGQVPNQNFAAISASIRDYAAAHGIAMFDLYAATGGATSALKWRSNELLAKDGIHFTADGYTLQGVLIYNALMRGLHR